jgi:hypothetical protein
MLYTVYCILISLSLSLSFSPPPLSLKGRTDDIMFSGMLAGQMLSRHAGFGDLPSVPFASFQSSMRAQLATHVAQSYNFFPPKVYNLSTNFR